MVSRPLSQLASWLAPPRCGICGLACAPEACTCGGCEARLSAPQPLIEPGPSAVDSVIAAGPFEGVVRELALALKFSRRLPLARRAAEAIVAAAPRGILAEGESSIVPVPPSPLRWRSRGFDPAEEIAIALASIAGLPYDACLDRRGGPRQVGRPRRERIADPPRIFLASPAPTRALLVDDVHTTGATLSAGARALRGGGCEEVVALTLARAC